MAATLGQDNQLRDRSYIYDHETGLYYLQSRYYSPEIGRFINEGSGSIWTQAVKSVVIKWDVGD